MNRKVVQVDKGIPAPVIPKVSYKWPWKNMKEVGDSFLCPLNRQAEDVVLERMRVQCHNMGKKLGMKFIASRHTRGIRVWRTEMPEPQKPE